MDGRIWKYCFQSSHDLYSSARQYSLKPYLRQNHLKRGAGAEKYMQWHWTITEPETPPREKDVARWFHLQQCRLHLRTFIFGKKGVNQSFDIELIENSNQKKS